MVFETLVGDTEQIAQSVVDGLDADFDIVLADIRDTAATVCADFDLIVTGSPTHTFGVRAPDDTPDVDTGHLAMAEWLARMPPAHRHQFCACFDTRTPVGTYAGESASMPATRTLHQHGYTVLSRQSFLVASVGGPLLPGELDRARAWAHSLAARVTAT